MLNSQHKGQKKSFFLGGGVRVGVGGVGIVVWGGCGMSAGTRLCSRGFLKGGSRGGVGMHQLAQERNLAEEWVFRRWHSDGLQLVLVWPNNMQPG